jgi:hypothetical protein
VVADTNASTLTMVPGDHLMAVIEPTFHAALIDFVKS